MERSRTVRTMPVLARIVGNSDLILTIGNMPVDSVLVNEFRLGDACSVPYLDAFFDVARSERLFLYLSDRPQSKK